MTAITSSTAAESTRSGGTGHLAASLLSIAAAALVLIVGVTGSSVISRIEFLLAWNDTFTGSGSFTVVACQPEPVFGPDRWRCQGRLTTGEATDLSSELVVGKDAWMSSRPYVGEQIDVYYDPASVAGAAGPPVVHASDSQLSELTRLYLVLPPLLIILVGAAGSLLGLALKRLKARSSNVEAWWRTSPLFLDLDRRGAFWLGVGVVAFGLYQLLVRYVLGSAGVG